MDAAVPLVYEYRGDVLDLIHSGHIVIVDEKSRVLYSSGDPDAVVFYRSASKPLQALPAVKYGFEREYGLTDEETVIFAGSHSGEPFHIAVLESIYSKADLNEDMLVMKPAAPLFSKANEERISKGLPKRKLYHNCSGKHTALMLLQRKLTGKVDGYWKLDSAAQREVMETIKITAETALLETGLDGCGVPVFACGLKHIAVSFKNLVRPALIRDEALSLAAADFVPRIHRYPLMMAGTGRLCAILNGDPNITAKGGANGVYGFALKKEGLGVAFKLSAGTDHSWPLIVLGILRALGALSPETGERLEALHPDTILNDNGDLAGRREIAFAGVSCP